MNNNTLTTQEKRELAKRVRAYLILSGETKSELSERLGFNASYISNLVSDNNDKTISRQAKVLIEYALKEFGDDLIDKFIEENASVSETVVDDCGMIAINNIDKKLNEILDAIQNSRTLYIGPMDSVEMIKACKKFGIRRDKFILYAVRYFYFSQLHNLERDGENYTLPRNCLTEVK